MCRTKILTAVACVALIGLAANAAWAVDIETVHVGNPGNTADTTGYGAVSYEYNIGKYEVTAGQYCEFLNAVAATDTYGLYNSSMWSSDTGCKIQQSGTSDSYTYSVANDWANRPVNYVSFWDACRFANWLNNGQGGAGTTEYGAYTLTADGMSNNTITRNAGCQWAVTSEDEWYKAAYYNPVSSNYYDYPTSSNSLPSNDLVDPDPGNNATFYASSGPLDPGDSTIGSPYWRTEVGAHENSESPYGTFDQGGNISEWNEAIILESYRGIRGGSYHYYDGGALRASYRVADDASYEGDQGHRNGFRVAAVPEPGSVGLLALGGVGLFAARRRRK